MPYLKKLFISALVLAIACSLGFPSLTCAGNKKHNLKIAQTAYPKGSAHQNSIERIAKEVTEQTNGRIKFKVYGTELGDWAELNEMVSRGDIDMMLSPLSSSYDPRWNATFTPYIVTTYEEAKEVFGPGSEMDGIFKTWTKDINMVWLGTWLQGFAGISLSERPATTPEEASGIKVRTPPIAAFECYLKKLGFTPALIPYSEVPTAISTGVVDGQAGGGPFQTYSCCRDLNKYFVFYRDYLELWGYTINIDTWNAIEPDDQKIIQEVVSKEVDMRVNGAKAEDMKYIQELRDSGLTVVDLADTPEKLNAAKNACRECWTKMDEIVGKVWMDKIRKIVNVK